MTTSAHQRAARLLLTLAAVLFAQPSSAAEASRPPIKRLPAATLGGASLSFSRAVRVEHILYLSGEIGADPQGRLPSDFSTQARYALERVTSTLKQEGLGWKDVFRCTIYLSDMAHWAEFNGIYSTFVDPLRLPARTAVGSSGLAFGAQLEVQCEALEP